ncbi:hypothetical protein FNF31_06035 [Cafeteria roenbergensis]|uniref:Amine oxidase domain-containing protein n=1 Tax=Cafeteria roenbergensis TaxID=33653 RepID=A0A5A8CRT0_CAFRO|nr:hypothetical protein FNF31_06035 [Cafeteria roenbergensis]
MRAAVVLLLASALGSALRSCRAAPVRISCDIVVAGGSTASVAAAITAAEAAPELRVCLTELTDWPGGQLTAGGVPAIDFGELNWLPENQPRSFREMIDFLGGASHNPGACWVSRTCYMPNALAEGYLLPKLRSLPNLRLLLRTAVVDTIRDPSGRISSLTAVQRTPRNASSEWTARLSDELPDWYDPNDSPAFTKATLLLSGSVFVEATELADVLVTGNFSWTQGAESPTENATDALSGCGQAWTMTFYMTLLAEAPVEPHVVPPGSAEGSPWPAWSGDGKEGWVFRTWNYRRSACAGNTSLFAANVGDVSQQNLGNDLDTAYVPLPADLVRAERPWQGGLNLTALRMLEDRAFGYFHYVRSSAPDPAWTPRLTMDRNASGTQHGLSKFIYLRDTRRGFGLPAGGTGLGADAAQHSEQPASQRHASGGAAGSTARGGKRSGSASASPADAAAAAAVGWPPPAPARPAEGFRLMYYDLSQRNASAKGVPSVRPADAVGIQVYNDDCHRLAPSVCSLPGYMAEHDTRPFWLPARMLLQRGAPNLLLAGKTAAQTFHANGAVRLHPGEWTMGVASGAAAVLFARGRMADTAELLQDDAAQLRTFVNSTAVGQPLDWTGGASEDPQIGYQCQPFGTLGRCVGVDQPHRNSSEPVEPDATCAARCPALAKNEWLADGAFWTKPDASGDIHALVATLLKKSVAQSVVLPPSEVASAPAGTPCRVLADGMTRGYWLCRASVSGCLGRCLACK